MTPHQPQTHANPRNPAQRAARRHLPLPTIGHALQPIYTLIIRTWWAWNCVAHDTMAGLDFARKMQALEAGFTHRPQLAEARSHDQTLIALGSEGSQAGVLPREAARGFRVRGHAPSSATPIAPGGRQAGVEFASMRTHPIPQGEGPRISRRCGNQATPRGPRRAVRHPASASMQFARRCGDQEGDVRPRGHMRAKGYAYERPIS
jgi:hypothetical protein